MDGFVVILGLFLTILIIILVYNNNKELFSLCSKKPGFFQRFLNFLNGSFIEKDKKAKKDDSFTVPVDERNNLMRNEGDNYYWSWQ